MSVDPTVVVAPDADTLAAMAAEVVVEVAAGADQRFTLALSGGSTPQGLYALLAREAYRSRLPWDRTHVFFADERCVPPSHPDSNFGMVERVLLSQVDLPSANIHRMTGEALSAPNAAQEYEWELCAACCFSEPCDAPSLDLIILGIGDDGHTASLFPGTAALGLTDRWCVANRVPRLATTRLTLTYPVLAASRRMLLLVSGAGKADVISRVLAKDPRLPATKAVLEGADVTLLLDSEAASALG